MKLLLLLPFIGLFVVSCSTSTPTTRIKSAPQLFEPLSPKHKELVSQGTIEKGMPKDAVYLAWGNPDSRSEGEQSGRPFEKWLYSGLAPVHYNSYRYGFTYGPYYGRRYGRYSRGLYPNYRLSTGIGYTPVLSKWVKFQNGRVESWQRRRYR